MDHLLNWVEIPVANMKRAMRFYRELLGIDVHEMKLGIKAK
jgi:predicted enzyme related to lactoylglutathione lyase